MDYDLTMNASSSYRDSMFEDLSDEGSYVFSLHEKGDLPFKMTVCVYTTLLGGDVVNVYKYDTENNEFILLAKNVEVGAGGSVAFGHRRRRRFRHYAEDDNRRRRRITCVNILDKQRRVLLTLPLIVAIIVFLTLGCLGADDQ
jgi:hypothetical protein